MMIGSSGVEPCASMTALRSANTHPDGGSETVSTMSMSTGPPMGLNTVTTSGVTSVAAAPVDSKLVTFYAGQKAGQTLGYAFIETNVVRTLPETFLIVLSPQGVVQKLFVLAFYEPEEYLPPERWLRQFDQKTLGPALQIRRDIHGIAGSTLSARAVTGGVHPSPRRQRRSGRKEQRRHRPTRGEISDGKRITLAWSGLVSDGVAMG